MTPSVPVSPPNKNRSLIDALEQRRLSEAAPDPLPVRVAVALIRREERLFQPRQLIEAHLSDLRQALGRSRELDALTVLQVGADPFVIDGHHRLTTYERAKTTDPIPVQYFTGTVAEAVLEAGRLNHKAKLPMDNRARMNRAWQLVRLGCFTKREEREGSGVSDGQVAEMRRVLKALGEEADGHGEWWSALRAFKGMATADLDEAALKERLEAQAADYSNRLYKEFGTKLTANPELAAMALGMHFGRNLPGLISYLRRCSGALAGDGDEDGDF